ncbi:MAG: GNAT family N-acetyltransferase [Dehalococcoidales bacterium]|nr:MAG: GNAT family N-acetyltransferase [Dehalococcoidales bacterium]
MAAGHEKGRRPEIVIRQMEIDDVSSVYHLGEKLFTSDEFPILYRTWDPYEVTDYFSSDPDYCLVAEVEGEVAGFVLANTIEKEGTAWKKYGYLSWIGVDEAFQRFNLGLRLYRKLEDRLREEGVRMVIADTDAGNRGAIKFFEKLGFTERSRHVWLAKTLRRPVKKASRTDEVTPPSSSSGETGQNKGR